ncbi:MAG: histidine triad nucleotide-binding protein [Actinomycetota bacterium]
MQKCLFCTFVSGEIKPDVVYEDEHVLAFRDINPVAPVHVLIIPKEHIPDVAAISGHHSAMLVALYDAARMIAESEGVARSGYRLVANAGRDGGQSVFHLHVHLLGGRQMGWPPG